MLKQVKLHLVGVRIILIFDLNDILLLLREIINITCWKTVLILFYIKYKL